MGHMADRFVASRNLLGFRHLSAALAMFVAWAYADAHPQMELRVFFIIYLAFLAFYMPTLALANTTTFAILKSHGERPVDHFPSIRVWGTIGFVAAMWFVNSAYYHDGTFGFTLSDSDEASPFRFQYNSMQLLAASVVGVLTAVYVTTLPAVKTHAGGGKSSMSDIFGLKAFRLFKVKPIRVFLIFAVFTGVCLQISNGFAIPYINHFMGVEEYASSLAAGNATMLVSLSQLSEAVCILFVGVAMKRIGFKWVVALALLAWCLRFLFLGIGNPGSGLWLFVASMLVYGVAFDFFNISGHIYMGQDERPRKQRIRSGNAYDDDQRHQSTFGMIAVNSVINSYCHWEMVAVESSQMRLFMGEWVSPVANIRRLCPRSRNSLRAGFPRGERQPYCRLDKPYCLNGVFHLVH